ncbi:hypothetical protein [Cupriavidus basilensis]|uniref:hypothetical protein n=1 Tax=Cupriavidus basilensis TaxID=68895 RepID=UPI00157AE77B|nr:hypothetical protein [Cupriavidus basilensis]NUA27709.1 MFS transporter [Cupriavidus basilensis]
MAGARHRLDDGDADPAGGRGRGHWHGDGAPLACAVLAGTAQHHAGVAAGVLATVQQVGNSVGVALVGNLFYARRESAGTAHGYGSAFAWCLGCLLGLALLVTHLCRGRRLAAAL